MASENSNALEELYNVQLKIIKILRKLEEIEERNGLNSEAYYSMCRLLRDFLDEEEKCVGKIIQEPYLLGYVIKKLREKEVINLDEALWASNFDMEDSILYRMNKLLNAYNPSNAKLNSDYAIRAFADEEINIDFLNKVKDPSLKYNLSFVNPIFCYDMTQNYFNNNVVCPDISTFELKNDVLYEIKKINYLLKRLAEIMGFMALNKEYECDLYYDILLSIKKLVPEVFITNLLETLSQNGLKLEDLNYIYNNIREREKKQSILKKKLD